MSSAPPPTNDDARPPDQQPAAAPRPGSSTRIWVGVLVAALVAGAAVTAFVVLDGDDGSDQAAPTVTVTATPGRTPPGTRTPTRSPAGDDTPVSPGADPVPPAGAGDAGAVIRDAAYCSNDGVELLFDYFRPDTTEPTPFVLYIHGGAWSGGNKSQLEQRGIFQPLLDSGYSVATISYRNAPEFPFPAPIIDSKCAIRHFRANADAYGLDPDRFAALGFSSGAHLAMLSGVADESAGFDIGQYGDVSSALSAVIEIDGPGDIPNLETLPPELATSVFSDSAELMTQVSPVTYIDADDPPFLIMHGELDATVPVSQAEQFAALLDEAGVPHEVIIVPGGGHRMPNDDLYNDAMIAFLDANV